MTAKSRASAPIAVSVNGHSPEDERLIQENGGPKRQPKDVGYVENEEELVDISGDKISIIGYDTMKYGEEKTNTMTKAEFKNLLFEDIENYSREK